MEIKRRIPGNVLRSMTQLLQEYVPTITEAKLRQALAKYDPEAVATDGSVFWTAKEASEKLGVCERTIQRMVSDGQLPVVLVGTKGREFRISVPALLALAEYKSPKHIRQALKDRTGPAVAQP